MSAQHTPKPWRIDDSSAGELEIVGRPSWACNRFGVAGEWSVAIVDGLLDEHQGEVLANGMLIAAAPELLEAARLGLKYMEKELTTTLECCCVLDADHSPIRSTLDDHIRPYVAQLEADIAIVKSAIAKAEGGAS